MTNLVGIITVSLVTNWATVSVTTPVRQGPGWELPTLHQVGQVGQITWFETSWQGKPVKAILNYTNLYELKRDIQDNWPPAPPTQ